MIDFQTLDFPRKHPPKPQDEVLAEIRSLEARNKHVRHLVAASREMAAGTSFEHPGFLSTTPRVSREVKRLLVDLGVLHVRVASLEALPGLRAVSQAEAARVLAWWDSGDAEASLRDEWESAIRRSRGACAARGAGHWDPTFPFTQEDVRKTMKGQRHWVGEIHYGWIANLLLKEAKERENG